jgi:thioredoxin reductase
MATGPDTDYDVVIVGGGPAGMSAALVLGRMRRRVLVFDTETPANAVSHGVGGLLSRDGIPPAELRKLGREDIAKYPTVEIRRDEVTAARSADERFEVDVGGETFTTRKLLLAHGLDYGRPEIHGLEDLWGDKAFHCPYCHGWEVRDEPIGILATGPVSIDHAYLFRQLTEDLTYFTHGTDLDQDSRARFAARGIRVIDTPVTEVVDDADGALAGVRLADGQVVARRVVAVASPMQARTKGLEGLGLPVQDGPKGRGFASGMAGATEVPGVWVAGNVTDLVAQVGASAAAGALAGADINKTLAIADTDAALQKITEASPKAATR